MLTWCRWRALYQSRVPLLARYYSAFDEDLPRITVPQKMVRKLAKHNARKAREEAMKIRPKLTTLVISSRNKNYRFYKGQKFDVFDPNKLASHAWKNRGCNHDYFTLVSHKPNPAVSDKDVAGSFEKFDLDKRILQHLQNEGIDKPTNIQCMAIPELLVGNHMVCAAETGSGKTYAYLLPIVHNILQQKKLGILSDDIKNSPHTIILVPAMELANQIMEVCENMAKTVHFKPFIVDRERRNKAILRDGRSIDLLISTPGTLLNLFRSKYIHASKMTCLVLDEADTLLDDSFCDTVRGILRKLQVGESSTIGDDYVNEGVQVSLVSATFPQELEKTIGDVLPIDSFSQVTTRNLHRLMPHVPQKFIKMKSVDRLATLLGILKKKHNQTYMIFCNKLDACIWLSNTLEEMGLNNVCVAGRERTQERFRQLKSFMEGETDVLVCTDIASRGLDTSMVDHVINYDCPNHISDYIHRSGRVGRVGSKTQGQVTTFIIHPWDVDLVWKIEISARRQMELDNVNANIKAAIKERRPAKKGLQLRESND